MMKFGTLPKMRTSPAKGCTKLVPICGDRQDFIRGTSPYGDSMLMTD